MLIILPMNVAQKQQNTIKADTRHCYTNLYGKSSRNTEIKEKMFIYARRPLSSAQHQGLSTRSICGFEGPYISIDYAHNHPDFHGEIVDPQSILSELNLFYKNLYKKLL